MQAESWGEPLGSKKKEGPTPRSQNWEHRAGPSWVTRVLRPRAIPTEPGESVQLGGPRFSGARVRIRDFVLLIGSCLLDYVLASSYQFVNRCAGTCHVNRSLSRPLWPWPSPFRRTLASHQHLNAQAILELRPSRTWSELRSRNDAESHSDSRRGHRPARPLG